MRKFKKITAAVFAAALMMQGTALLPEAKAESTTAVEYDGVLGTKNGTDPVDPDAVASNDAWLTNTVTVNNDKIISYNATEIKKVLEIEEGTSIPSCSFGFAVVAGEPVAAHIENGVVQTLAVKEGLNPDKIEYKLENVDGTAFVTNSNTAYVSQKATDDNTGLYKYDGYNGFTIEYQPQAVTLPTSGSKAADDNVLINNVDGDTYYAIKTVQMDFPNCGFTEPGIYRYVIAEGNSGNTAIENDVTNTSNQLLSRTLDVYVEDATYNTATGKKYDLRIAGYVMYMGIDADGPAAGEATIANPEAKTMEDGLTHTNLSGNGGANGVEVAGAEKSEGYRNLYRSNNLTFKKTVSGNQASNDQFFRFTLTLAGSNIDDKDVFVISKDESKLVIEAGWEGKEEIPNSATVYTKGDIYAANSAVSLTGAQLKAGYDFYLQADQYVTILGIPEGASYELLEYYEDYKPTVELEGGNGYDNMDGGKDSSAEEITEPELFVATDGNAARIKDSSMVADVSATFNNEKKGTIPTGVIMHVLPIAGIAAVLFAGVIIIFIKRKNDEEEQ